MDMGLLYQYGKHKSCCKDGTEFADRRPFVANSINANRAVITQHGVTLTLGANDTGAAHITGSKPIVISPSL